MTLLVISAIVIKINSLEAIVENVQHINYIHYILRSSGLNLLVFCPWKYEHSPLSYQAIYF